MRTFIAIELSQEIKNNMAILQEELRKTGADVKWVEPQNIHLTLKFLGERDEKKVEQISRTLEEVGKENNAYPLRISLIGAFPKINFPRVIWVGLDEGDTETKKIAQELEEKIAKLGIPKEKREFSSHITIGRVRSGLNREKLILRLQNLSSSPGRINLEARVNKITLFKSTLTPKGPIYEVLKEANLKTI